MSYSERRHTLTKKQLAQMGKWASPASQQTTAADKAAITQQQRELWDALHSFIRQNGGAVVSPAHTYPIRLEVTPGSDVRSACASLVMTRSFWNKQRASGRS
jgi:hypothetical protein